MDQRLNNVFYQNDNGITELVDEDQDLLLDDQEDEDMLFNNDAED